MEKTNHQRRVADLEARPEPVPPPAEASVAERMRYRLATSAGRALYRLRQQTVEPVFGIIKEALGFRRFSLRGLAGAELEWTLVCLAYNVQLVTPPAAGSELSAGVTGGVGAGIGAIPTENSTAHHQPH